VHKTPTVRIAIDCRIWSFQQGTGTAVLSLANALSKSADVGQEYTFIVHEHLRESVAPHVSGPCRLQTIPVAAPSGFKSRLRAFAPLRAIARKVRKPALRVPASDGFVESEGFDMVHFPTQAAYLTELPSIYQPWDLQHLHYPQFFSQGEWERRELEYRAFCSQARYVCVQTEWSRQDVIQKYGIAPEKVVVIRWGSVFDAYTEPSIEAQQAISQKFALPKQFFFYPAVTWPHKNHEVIFRALSLLKREHQRIVDVYFTGASTEYRGQLDELARSLGVSEQLHFLGFVSPEELQSIFRAATAMVFPSKFEGFGLPVLEAFHAGAPVLSSNATVLPEVAQDAALYFDPDAPTELANLMIRMLDEPGLRESLIAKGKTILSQFSIDDTAVQFQKLYALTATRQGREGRNEMAYAQAAGKSSVAE